MDIQSFHVLPGPHGVWKVKTNRRVQLFKRRGDAIEKARELSRKANAELIIHGEDGTSYRARHVAAPVSAEQVEKFVRDNMLSMLVK
jgi:hypothetical protein